MEKTADCSKALRTNEFLDLRPRKYILDFYNLPCVGDDLDLVALNQGKEIGDLLAEKETDPEIRINDCAHEPF